MNKPQYVKVNNKLYKINTDFRIAIECNNISEDITIGDTERALAIIYKLFGEDGLNCEDKNKLLELGIQYLSLGRAENGLKIHSDEKFELDIEKCKNLIASSFKFDYNYNPYELEYLHWYDFYNDLENLSTSEFGNCCALNRIITILNKDEKNIKDSKDKKDFVELKKELIQKYCKIKEEEMTKEQEESAEAFYEALKQKGG